ncbi:hypothetical protein ACXYVG_03405 [Mesomycoplasma ovipneumoniae]
MKIQILAAKIPVNPGIFAYLYWLKVKFWLQTGELRNFYIISKNQRTIPSFPVS